MTRRWTIAKSAEGEWMSFDLYGKSATDAWLSYHRTHADAINATYIKIRQEARR